MIVMSGARLVVFSEKFPMAGSMGRRAGAGCVMLRSIAEKDAVAG